MFRSFLLLIGALTTFTPILAAESGVDPPVARAGFLFSYQPNRGEAPLFEEGYRKHLDWHRGKEDRLVWYGWSVVFGERLGLFIDGTFGQSFAAMDERVDPRGDRADFTATAAPYAAPVARRALELLPELSNEWLLERQAPSAMIEVVHYVVRPGRAGQFEQVLARLMKVLRGRDDAPPMTTYRLVAGGEKPTYMLMFPLAKWGDYDRSLRSISHLAATVSPANARRALLDSLSEAVTSARSEIWRYRKDLSYFPPR